jgi:integrase
MARKKSKKFTGVRYREHATRKDGGKNSVNKDRYYTIRYKVKGTDKEEALGWTSQGWTAEKAYERLKEIKENIKTGEGFQSLQERRDGLTARRERERVEQEQDDKKAVTFGKFFNDTYLPNGKTHKSKNTVKVEEISFRIWIEPAIGDIPLRDVAQTDVERIKKKMLDAGKSPRTVQLCLGFIRQVYNYAKSQNLYNGDTPVARVKLPRVDNAKLRYLSPEEIDKLLTELKVEIDSHDMALLSVNCGLRFSEAASLRWEDVNYDTGTLSIRDSKTGSRTSYINEAVKAMLEARRGVKTTGLIFAGKDKERQKRATWTFARIADKLFNSGVKDRRLRVTFHTLRHSFGTAVYNSSGDLYLTQKALGHKTLQMAQRYAKMSEPRLREAFQTVGDILKNGEAKQNGQVVNFAK